MRAVVVCSLLLAGLAVAVLIGGFAPAEAEIVSGCTRVALGRAWTSCVVRGIEAADAIRGVVRIAQVAVLLTALALAWLIWRGGAGHKTGYNP